MRAIGLGLVVAVVAISAMVSRFVGWACSSGEEARGSLEEDLCAWFDATGSLEWWLAILWPALLYGASQLIPVLRRHAFSVAVLITAAAVAFWIAVAVVVIDV